MPGYQVKNETATVGGTDYLIRSLLDLQQYSDPFGEAELAGISPASWPLFGLWPSARVLAQAMHSFDLTGDMTVRDRHEPRPTVPRRPLRLLPDEFHWNLDADGLQLEFFLPAGDYATTLVREMVSVRDQQSRAGLNRGQL